jgi:FG-GAP-like repeat
VLDRGTALPDAVVVSSGSNAVIVYRTMGVSHGAVTFAPTPQTYFVGTTPTGLTVGDVNGDGIPDLLVANEGSNDVSVIFGSYDASGGWIGTPGPRLKSGGDGPMSVTVRNVAGTNAPDLVVTNGGSGTVTALRGVGQGFFDDQHPLPLFDLGSAVAQPPTFVSTSGVGYAVTAAGTLVRFDLGNPAVGAHVVYSAQDVLAARALTNGDVVIAVAGGAVKLLVPAGDNLSVAADLQAQSGVPILPSALEIVSTSGGLSEVLVSSAGSSTVFVFAPAAVSVSPVTGLLGQLTALPPIPVLPFTGAQASSGVGGGTVGGTSSSAAAAGAAAAPGLSLGGAASSVAMVAAGPSNAADLVAVQGNTYATVALLGLASQYDDEVAPARRPDLANRFPIGDTSPLLRFLSGQADALRQFRGAANEEMPLDDPWREDLFQGPLSAPRPLLQSPAPQLPDREEVEDATDAPMAPAPSPDIGLNVGSDVTEAIAVLLAGTLLAPLSGQRRRHEVGRTPASPHHRPA